MVVRTMLSFIFATFEQEVYFRRLVHAFFGVNNFRGNGNMHWFQVAEYVPSSGLPGTR